MKYSILEFHNTQKRRSSRLFCEMPSFLTIYRHKYPKMRRPRQDPGDGIGNVKHPCLGECGEDRHDPNDTKQAGTDKRGHHRKDRAPEASDRAADGIHDPAKEIESANDPHAGNPRRNGVGCVRQIEEQNLWRKRRQNRPNDNRHAKNEKHGIPQNVKGTLRFPRPDVLSDKADRRIREGIHQLVKEALDVRSRPVPRHHDGTERVDRALDQNV